MTGFDSIDKLLVKAGDMLSASLHWNPLVKEVFRKTWRKGRGVRLRQLPSQTMVGFRGSVPTVIDYRLKVQVSGDRVQIALGLIGGHEPTIEVDGVMVPISDEDGDSGEPPSLKLKDGDFEEGRCYLFAKVNLLPSWLIDTVEIVALSKPPSTAPWTGYKLLAVLFQDEPGGSIEAVQMVYFDLGHATSLRRSSGLAKHWFWTV